MTRVITTAFVAFALSLAVAPGAARAQAQGRLTIDHVAIVDVATGTIRRDMRVDIADGRITRVEPAAVAGLPREVRHDPAGDRLGGATGGPLGGAIGDAEIDGRGKFLMPGLWDAHVHLTKLGAGALAAFVAYGVTSVRDMGSDLAEVRARRREIEAGRRPGPRIETAGQILETPANVARMKREATVEPVDRIRLPVGSPAEAEAAVARLAKAGADLIKVRTVVDDATLRAMAAAAHAHGLKLAGHPVAAPETLIDIRMDSVEHLLTFPPLTRPPAERRALFERMRDAGVSMGTTTVNLEGSVLVPYDTAIARLKTDPLPLRRLVSRYLASDWQEQVDERQGPDAAKALAAFARALPDVYRDLREMHAAGVRFLAGSDAAVVFMYPGDSLHGELQNLVDRAGLTPVEALRAATMNPAAFFGLERESGAIETGYRADLVLLDGNPLEDIRQTRQIAGVVCNGRWHDRAALARLLDRAAADAKR